MEKGFVEHLVDLQNNAVCREICVIWESSRVTVDAVEIPKEHKTDL
jgi:hypothetical protein